MSETVATTDDLADIRAREAAATPGPWLTPDEAGDPYKAPALAKERHCAVLDHEGCDCWPWAREEDMAFAYGARSDVPRLLALVDELRAILAPLLDNPVRPAGCDSDGCGFSECVLCGCEPARKFPYGPNDYREHERDCPALRRVELLGRAP